MTTSEALNEGPVDRMEPRDHASAGRRLRMALQIGEWALSIAAVLLVLGSVVLMAGPRLLGWDGVIVLSGSMEPALKVGGLAFVDPGVDPANIKTGDIITFRSPADENVKVSHRVVEVVHDNGALSFRTKGDANEDADGDLVPAANVLGRVKFSLPYLGHVADKLRHHEVFYMIIGIPAGLLVLGELFNVSREMRRKAAAP